MTYTLEATDLDPFPSMPPDYLACLDCGIGVPPPHAPSTLETVTAFGPAVPQRNVAWRADSDFVMTRCAPCATRHATADRLLDEHPAVAHSIGSRSIGVYRVSSALAAVAAIGVHPPTFATDIDLRRFLHAMAELGVLNRWARLFSPALTDGVTETSCGTYPWSHVGKAAKGRMRDAYAGYLRLAIEQPRRYRPPAPSDAERTDEREGKCINVTEGCLACGIGSVMALPSRQFDAWTVAKCAPSVLGGHGAAPLAGYLCGPCARAVQQAGAYGPTAWGKSVLAYLEVRNRGPVEVELNGIVGWAALAAASGNRTPNTSPWAHLAGLDDVKASVQ